MLSSAADWERIVPVGSFHDEIARPWMRPVGLRPTIVAPLPLGMTRPLGSLAAKRPKICNVRKQHYFQSVILKGMQRLRDRRLEEC
jgi:hypothetical protein